MLMKDLGKEVKYKTSRSSGSGGQHVNKVETKVELYFDIPASDSLNDKEKYRLQEELKNRINKDGVLIVSSQATRSQALNRSKVWKKFQRLVKSALRPKKKRKAVGSLQANPRKRLESKRKQAEKKQARKKVMPSRHGL